MGCARIKALLFICLLAAFAFPIAPLFLRPLKRGIEGKEEERRGHGEGALSLLTCPCGCVLAPSCCWKPSPEPSFVKRLKGNALATWFCPFPSPPATSLGLVCAPMIHEFITDTAQSGRVHAGMCVWIAQSLGATEESLALGEKVGGNVPCQP